MNQYKDDDPGFLTADEAAERLGIQKQTLYAYVSRGLVESVESSDGRSRLYRGSDVEELEQRRDQRRRPGETLRRALHFGSPLLESSLTLIRDGRLYYRGQSAIELSRSRGLEEVAAWLWTEDLAAASELFSNIDDPPTSALDLARGLRRPWSTESLQILVPLVAESDPRAWATHKPREAARAGARLLCSMARLATVGHDAPSTDVGVDAGVAERLAAAWGPADAPEAARHLLDSALVLCADHELNVSSFTARCVASAGSPVYSSVAAGLAALHGFRHGGHTRRLEALLREAETPDGVHDAVTERLRRGEPVPGFGQVLYPDGDPRFLELRNRIGELFPGSPALAWADALQAVGRDLLDEHPTVDVGLALVARALALPRDGALTLFALGRTVGWVGHALEQYGQDRLIRPRARYVGTEPTA